MNRIKAEEFSMARFCFIYRHIAILWFACAAVSTSTRAADFAAPNLVAVTSRIVTSGQPTVKALEALKENGFEAVVFLVPSDVSGVIADEADIVKKSGLEYVHIPIKFSNPTTQHYDEFVSAMTRFTNRKVLVHCEINLRASSMVFLYRAIALKEDPQAAYESVAKVWSPRGAWKPFIQEMLRKNNIAFEPY
jgi:protein tyrosine phosphatase (PTP) superfamily phosphohydrolase (DUF442 family)